MFGTPVCASSGFSRALEDAEHRSSMTGGHRESRDPLPDRPARARCPAGRHRALLRLGVGDADVGSAGMDQGLGERRSRHRHVDLLHALRLCHRAQLQSLGLASPPRTQPGATVLLSLRAALPGVLRLRAADRHAHARAARSVRFRSPGGHCRPRAAPAELAAGQVWRRPGVRRLVPCLMEPEHGMRAVSPVRARRHPRRLLSVLAPQGGPSWPRRSSRRRLCF